MPSHPDLPDASEVFATFNRDMAVIGQRTAVIALNARLKILARDRAGLLAKHREELAAVDAQVWATRAKLDEARRAARS